MRQALEEANTELEEALRESCQSLASVKKHRPGQLARELKALTEERDELRAYLDEATRQLSLQQRRVLAQGSRLGNLQREAVAHRNAPQQRLQRALARGDSPTPERGEAPARENAFATPQAFS